MPLAAGAPEGADALVGGGHPAGMPWRRHRWGDHGVSGHDRPQEAPVGGHLQPQPAGGGRCPAGDGQRAEGAPRGEAHIGAGSGEWAGVWGDPESDGWSYGVQPGSGRHPTEDGQPAEVAAVGDLNRTLCVMGKGCGYRQMGGVILFIRK